MLRGESGDLTGKLIAAGLGNFALNSLGKILDSPSIEAGLRSYGIVPRYHEASRTDVDRFTVVTNNWFASVSEASLDPAIPRQEASDLAATIIGASHRTHFVVGAGGSGKSAVLAQAARRLQDDGISVFAFRLDRLDSFSSTDDLGRVLGLSASPVAVVAEHINGQAAVLVIDQLDAASLLSGRLPENLASIEDLVREASAFENIQLVFGSRKFDIENDPRMRQLSTKPESDLFEVGNLTSDQVQEVLLAMGVDPAGLEQSQFELLSSPLNLRMLGGIVSQAAFPQFESANQLFDVFWERKANECRRRSGRQVRFDAIIFKIVDSISTEQSLAVPMSVLDGDDLSADAAYLVSENVLVRDGSKIAFFHESFFDYAFARRWMQSGQSLVDFVNGTKQELFRRSQVRQVLNYLREVNADRFRSELLALLTEPSVRFHIKAVALAVLKSLASPTTTDWTIVQMVLDTNPDFSEHVWTALRTDDWFDRLDSDGMIMDWLGMDEEQQRHALELMPTVARTKADRLAEVLRAHAHNPEIASWVRWVVRFADISESRPLFDVLLEAVRRGVYDTEAHSLWLSSYGLAQKKPDWAAELLGAFLIDRSGAMEPRPDGTLEALKDNDHTVIDLVQHASDAAPTLFVEKFAPYILGLLKTTEVADSEAPKPSRQFSAHYISFGTHELDQAIIVGLVRAFGKLISDDAATWELLEPFARDDHDVAQWILYKVALLQPSALALRIADVMLEGPHRFRGTDAFELAASVLSAICAHITDTQHQSLERQILDFRLPWDKQYKLRYRYDLLSALCESKLSPTGRKKLAEFRRQFSPKSTETIDSMASGFIRSPIPPDKARLLTDDQWIRAFIKHNQEGANWATFTGGVHELASMLQKSASENTDRFLVLALKLTSNVNPNYANAILLGVSQAEKCESSEAVFAAVRHIASLGHPENDQWLGLPLKRFRGHVPVDMVQLVADKVLTSPDPEFSDDEEQPSTADKIESQSMNCARGALALDLAVLLSADTDGILTNAVVGSLSQMASDPVVGVRAAVADVILTCLRFQPEQAITAFKILIDFSDSILSASTVRRLIHAVGYTDIDTVKLLIDRMLSSTVDGARERGGELAAMASAQWGLDGPLQRVRSGSDREARIGAARGCVYQLVGTTNRGQIALALTEFCNDQSPEVREASAEVAVQLRGERLAPYRGLLLSMINSPTFSDMSVQMFLTLEAAPDRVDDLAIAAARRFLEINNRDVADIRTAAAGDAREVGALLIRAYAQAVTDQQRAAVLDLVDQLLISGAYGVDSLVEASERQHD